PRTPMTLSLPWLAEAAEAAEKITGRPHSEAQLRLPDFTQVRMMGTTGWNILAIGIAVSIVGLLFGLWKYQRLRNMPVHKAMLEISELIYTTCKTYLRTQAKFIARLWILIASVIVIYFAALESVPPLKVMAIALF